MSYRHRSVSRASQRGRDVRSKAMISVSTASRHGYEYKTYSTLCHKCRPVLFREQASYISFLSASLLACLCCHSKSGFMLCLTIRHYHVTHATISRQFPIFLVQSLSSSSSSLSRLRSSPGLRLLALPPPRPPLPSRPPPRAPLAPAPCPLG